MSHFKFMRPVSLSVLYFYHAIAIRLGLSNLTFAQVPFNRGRSNINIYWIDQLFFYVSIRIPPSICIPAVWWWGSNLLPIQTECWALFYTTTLPIGVAVRPHYSDPWCPWFDPHTFTCQLSTSWNDLYTDDLPSYEVKVM